MVSKQLDSLSYGPSRSVSCFKGFIVNGFRFHTKDREIRRKTQNSGVFLSAETSSFASARDMNPVTGSVGYYGILKDILELRYCDGNRVILFKCDWWDVMSRAGIKTDEYGFTTINFTRTLPGNEPFILAAQAQQVFYLMDNLDKDWRVVLKTQARDLYDMGEVDPIQENSSEIHQDASNTVEDTHTIDNWTRNDISAIEVVANTVGKDTNAVESSGNIEDFIDDNSFDEDIINDSGSDEEFIEDDEEDD